MQMIKKIIIGISLITTTSIFANNDEVDIAKLNSIYKIDNIDKAIPGLKIAFETETGDLNFDKYIVESLKDKDFKLANYKLYEEKRMASVPIENKTYNLMTPKYDEALELFLKSSEKGNILSAFEGQKIIEKYFMSMGPNKVSEYFLGKFSSILMKKGYCKGYLYTARSLFKDFSSDKTYTPDYQKIYDISEKGLLECNKNVDNFYINALKKEKIKAKTMIKVVKAKLEAQTKVIQEEKPTSQTLPKTK